MATVPITRLALLVGSLVVSSHLAAQPPNPTAPADVIAIINRGACGNCHVIAGMPGADGEVGPDLSKLGTMAGSRKPNMSAKEYIRESILDPDAFITAGGYEKGVMPSKFGQTLSSEDLDTLEHFRFHSGVLIE
jgi:mono/diheme cytochrome c family protein